MLFRKYHPYSEKGVTPRRLAAAERALAKERAVLPLFQQSIAERQPTAAQRLDAFIHSNEMIYRAERKREAKAWRAGRRMLFSLHQRDRWCVVVRWNSMLLNHRPGGAAYFADFLAHWIRVRYPDYWFSEDRRTAQEWTDIIQNSPTYLTNKLLERERSRTQLRLF